MQGRCPRPASSAKMLSELLLLKLLTIRDQRQGLRRLNISDLKNYLINLDYRRTNVIYISTLCKLKAVENKHFDIQKNDTSTTSCEGCGGLNILIS